MTAKRKKAKDTTLGLEFYLPALQRRDVIRESYKITFSRNALRIYAQRILLLIKEAAQDEIDKLDFENGKDCRKIDIMSETGLTDRTVLTFHLRNIIGNTNSISDQLKNEIDELAKTTIKYEDDKRWCVTPFLWKAEILKDTNWLQVTIPKEVWGLIMNFSSGYRTISLKKALTIRSEFGLKIYEMLSGQKKELVFTIQQFREQFCLNDRYPVTTDLVRRIIMPAKKELDKKEMPYSFDFVSIYTPRPGRKPELTAFKFIPVYRPEFDENNDFRPVDSDNSEQAKERPMFTERQEQILFTYFGLTHEGIMRNSKLFKDAASTINFRDFFKKTLEAKSPDIKNPAGFFINELKKALKEAKEKKPNN